jgi:hypothetical protein
MANSGKGQRYYDGGVDEGWRSGAAEGKGSTDTYKTGGKVKGKSGKVHKGEYVIKKSAAKKIGTKKLNKMNDAARLKRTRMPR